MRNELNFLAFWAVNDRLEPERMMGQLSAMKEMGFHGTVFPPRYYPGIPAYMSEAYLDLLSRLILHAKEIGLQFWIYDENGWPSGSADGRVLEHFPDSRCRWMQYENGRVEWHEVHQFNTFDREEMKYFVGTVYDGYRLGLHPEAFDYVTGFFSDEVGFLYGHGVSIKNGGVPWCEEAGERYEKLYHEDVMEKLELLFVEKEGYHQFRYHYWQILTDLLAESFYQNCNDWCVRYGKRYTAHLKAEENLFFQTSCSGSVCWNLKNVNVPAVDALERYPGNHYYPVIASTLAKQFYDGESLAEALGGSGWGLSPENLENYVDWLAGSGINNMVFHLWQYNRSSASVRDWPPNIPMGLTWRETAPKVFERLKQRWNGIVGRHNHILIVAPARGVMASFNPADAMVINEHNGAGTPSAESGRISTVFGEFVEQCFEMGMQYDVTEERIVETYGSVEDGVLQIGNVGYDIVIEGRGCFWEKEQMIRDLYDSAILYRQDDFSWKFVRAGINQLLLENKDSRIPLWQQKPICGMQVRMLDNAKNVRVMGRDLPVSRRDENGWYYRIPDDVARKAFERKELCISIRSDDEKEPFVFLEGSFLVKCSSPYTEKDYRQMVTEGGFYLEEIGGDISCHDLLTAGFPFCGSAVTVECMAAAGEDGRIKLGHIHGDCARIWVDNREYGVIWGPAWVITGLTEGIHRITAQLVPSTFNSYGPHHHMEGDRHVISPAQYEGVKNFADSEEPPVCTKVPQWHFRKFGIGREI